MSASEVWYSDAKLIQMAADAPITDGRRWSAGYDAPIGMSEADWKRGQALLVGWRPTA